MGVWSVPVTALGSLPDQVAALPSGVDTGWTLSLAPNGDGTALDILFQRWICEQVTGDVYALRGVAVLP